MRSSWACCWCCCTALMTRFEPFKRPTAPGAMTSACARRSAPTTRSRSVAALRSAESSPFGAVANPSPLRPKGANHYELEVDQERGVLLAVAAIRDEQPFHKITTLAIGFDEPIPAETFQFAPPAGEEIQPAQSRRHSLQHIVCSTSPSPKRSSTLHSPFSCQTACPPAGSCTACSLRPLSSHHRRRWFR
jgi:hypothetical protein